MNMGLTAENACSVKYNSRAKMRTRSPIAATRTRSRRRPRASSTTRSCPSRSSGHCQRQEAQSDQDVFAKDEGPRADTTPEALAKLKPVFHAQGTVTAGNSSQTSDGAAAAIVMSDRKARELGLKPMARFVSFATGGVPPEIMGIGPVVAIPKALALAGLTLDDIGLIELNEAFARAGAGGHSGRRASIRTRVNVNGGAIALGHPLGCTGAKLTATILREMERRESNMAW